MAALYVLAAIAAVIALIIFIPIDVAFGIAYVEKNTDVRLVVKYFPAAIQILPAKEKPPKADKAEKDSKKKVKKKKDTKKKDDAEKQPLSQTIEFARAVLDETWEDIKSLIKHLFLHTLMVKRLFLTAKIGTGDPMNTGIAYGAANMFIYRMLAFIDKHSRLDEWKVSLDADFETFVIEGEAELIIRTRIAYVLKLGAMAVLILLKILKINRRIKKNGGK